MRVFYSRVVTLLCRFLGPPAKPLKKFESGRDSVSHSACPNRDWAKLRSVFSSRMFAWSGVTAALLLVGATFWTLLAPPSATIIEAQDAIWANVQSMQNGEALGYRWRTLESGTAKIAFRQGATMTVEGPAAFRVLSSTSCELQEGALTAYVPEKAVGFSVAVGNASIVDLGTTFRVDTYADGKAIAYVTQGMVQIDLHGRKESLTLNAGQIAEWSKSARPQLLPADSVAPKTSGNMVFDTHQPSSLGIGQYKHDGRAFVFLECRETVLRHELRLDVKLSGPHYEFTASEGAVPAGTHVRSYLIHFSPQQKRQILSGWVIFPDPILGILCDSDRLNATNADLGNTVLLRCQHAERGWNLSPT